MSRDTLSQLKRGVKGWQEQGDRTIAVAESSMREYEGIDVLGMVSKLAGSDSAALAVTSDIMHMVKGSYDKVVSHAKSTHALHKLEVKLAEGAVEAASQKRHALEMLLACMRSSMVSAEDVARA